MEEVAQKKLLATIKNLLDTGAFSDLTVTCGSDTYKVHKSIVCSRVEFFARAMRFGGKEAIEGTVDLPDDEPAIIKLLFQWIYEGEYGPSEDKTPVSSAVLETSQRLPNMFVPGPRQQPSYYTPPHLRGQPVTSGATTTSGAPITSGAPTTSVARFNHTCDNFLGACAEEVCDHHTCETDCDSDCVYFTCRICKPVTGEASVKEKEKELLIHAKMYEIADKYDVADLKRLVEGKFLQACKLAWDTPAFGNAAHYVFSTTPDHDKGLRNIVSNTIAAHVKKLLTKPEIEALLTEFNGLAYDLLKIRVYPELQ